MTAIIMMYTAESSSTAEVVDSFIQFISSSSEKVVRGRSTHCCRAVCSSCWYTTDLLRTVLMQPLVALVPILVYLLAVSKKGSEESKIMSSTEIVRGPAPGIQASKAVHYKHTAPSTQLCALFNSTS